MIIAHRLDDFAFEIFPETIKIKDNLKEIYFTKFYIYGIIKPRVKIEDGVVFSDIDTNFIESQGTEYKKVISLYFIYKETEEYFRNRMVESNEK